MSIVAFDDVVAELEPFKSVSASLGGKVAEQATLFLQAVDEEKKFIAKAIAMKKPSDEELQNLIAPISTLMGQIGEIKDKARGDPNFNHLTAVAEGTPALGWLVVEPTPGPYVKEMIGAAQFWTNKILKDFKGKDEKHVEWANSLIAFITALAKYVLQWHTTGVAWNSGGSAAAPAAPVTSSVSSGSASLEAFDTLIRDHVDDFVAEANKIGGPVAEQAAAFKEAVQAERALIEKAAKLPKKPSEAEMGDLLGDTSTKMGKVSEIMEKNRRHEHIVHLQAVAEGTPALGWVAVEPAPAPYAKEMVGAAQFYTNKILKEHKGKNETHVAFANKLVGFLQALVEYIKEHHTTGLTYNARVPSAVGAGAVSSAPSSGALADFDALVDEHLKPYVEISNKLGGPIAEQAKHLEAAVRESRKLYAHAAATKPKPSMDAFQGLLTPISNEMVAVGNVKDTTRDRKVLDHVTAVAEGVQVLAWVTVEPAPAPFAKEAAGAAKFWTNKVLKEYRGKDETQVAWVTALTGFFDAFEGYIKQHHTTGLSWGNAPTVPTAGSAPAVSTGGAVAAWNDLKTEHIDVFLAAANKIGGAVAEQANLFARAVQSEGELIAKAQTTKKPSEAELPNLLQATSELMGKVGEVKDKHPTDANANHLKAVAEAVQILGWVAVEPTPAPFAKEMIAGAEFWTNKILKDYRGKDETHVEFVNGLVGFLKAVPAYILQHHTTGLMWSK